MHTHHLIETLEGRVTEVEWFAQQNQLRVEPHLYPKGLFNAQMSPSGRYKVSVYVAELRQDLLLLKQITLPLMRSKAADKLLQKINVLINAFRSQSLRAKKSKNVHSLFENMDLANDNIYEKLANKNKPKANSILMDTLKKLEKDHANLTISNNQKLLALERCTSNEALPMLQNAVLELSKQIGAL